MVARNQLLNHEDIQPVVEELYIQISAYSEPNAINKSCDRLFLKTR